MQFSFILWLLRAVAAIVNREHSANAVRIDDANDAVNDAHAALDAALDHHATVSKLLAALIKLVP